MSSNSNQDLEDIKRELLGAIYKELQPVLDGIGDQISQRVDALKLEIQQDSANLREIIRKEIKSETEKLNSALVEKMNGVTGKLVGTIREIAVDLEKNKEDNRVKIENTLKIVTEQREELKNDIKTNLFVIKETNEAHVNVTQQQQTLIERLNHIDEKGSKRLSVIENELNENINTTITEIGETIKTLDGKIHSIETQQQTLTGDLQQIDEKGSKRISVVENELNENINTTITEIGETIKTLDEKILSVKTKEIDDVDNLQTELGKMKGIVEQLISSFTDELTKSNKQITNIKVEYGTKIDNITKISKNNAKVMISLSEINEQVRELIQETVSDLKKDQKDLLQSFQRINTGTLETLRNEMLVFTKEVRRILDAAETENEDNFLSVKAGDNLAERIKTLDLDMRNKAEAIRNELIKSLEKALSSFDSKTEESFKSVDSLKKETFKVRDDIQSLVERKVNEKYDFLFDILGGLLTKTEELRALVKEARIKANPPIMIPVEKKIITSEETIKKE